MFLVDFCIGDFHDAGHGRFEKYYFHTNHRAYEIKQAIKKIAKQIGFDPYVYKSNYENEVISELDYMILVENNLIDYDDYEKVTLNTRIGFTLYDEGNHIELLFKMAKMELSDLTWEPVEKPKSETIAEFGYGYFE